MEGKQKNLKQLFIPICLEILCQMLAGMADTLMLSSVGDKAVGAVGTANTYIGIFIIMFSIISSGMIAVMTQYIGAKKDGVAYQARQLGLVFNGIIGVLLAVLLFFGAESILNMVGIAPELMSYAATYLKIVGGGCFINALIPVFSSYLRAFGFTKQPLSATVTANIANLVMNAVFIFGLDMGVAGAAAATVLSRFLNLFMVMMASRHLIHIKDSFRLPRQKVFGQIIKIGLPSAAETALYNVAMTLIIRLLNQMDDAGINVTARSYAMQLANFSYCVGAALAQANAILTGWRTGSGKYEECLRETRKAALLGIITATVMETLIALSSGFLMQIFTDNAEITALVSRLLFIDIVLEIGRTCNLVFGNALKTTGDAVFTTVIAVIFMYLFAVGGTYFFGIRLGLLVTGAYIGMAMDECIRALCMFLRWQSGKWKEKRLVKS